MARTKKSNNGNSAANLGFEPSHVVRVLVEVLSPYKGRLYDPRRGSGGMFVQSEKFIEGRTSLLFAYTQTPL